MKKFIFILILCLLTLRLNLFADDDEFASEEDGAWIGDETEAFNDDNYWSDEDIAWFNPEEDLDFPQEDKEPFRMSKRRFEFGLLGLNLSFSNDFITTRQFFKEKVVIDLDDLQDGLQMRFGLNVNPLFFNFNKDDQWGFGVSIFNMEVFGGLALSGPMITFKQTEKDSSEIFGAAFVNFDFHGFFHIDKFRIRIAPTLYYPIAYVKPEKFTYTYRTVNHGATAETYLNLDVDLRVYTAFPTEGDFELTASPGVSFSVGADYPLSEALGINEKVPFLDFGVALDFYNIPMIPAFMHDYQKIILKLGKEEPLNLDFFGSGGMNMDDFFDSNTQHLTGRQRVFRPFKMIASADWRPLRGRELLTIYPAVGFAINPLFEKPASFEGGLKGRLNIANLFFTTLGIGYHDRLWINSLEFSLNFRAVQFDLGLSMQAPGFADSWSGGGFGISTGFRFGW